jgi:alkylation response protein AidB-like acyl-CoA dehydrogenase
MQFEPNEDQRAFLSVLEQITRSEEAAWKVSPEHRHFDWSVELDAALEKNGFFDCAAEETLGLVTGAAMTYRLATLPVAVECAASATLRALFAPHLPRPVAVIEGDTDRAAPFLPVAKSVICIGRSDVRAATLGVDTVEPTETLFAYPMGVLKTTELDWQPIDAEPEAVCDAWRIALAAETAGVLKGGLDAVVAHVRERHQFGRPLGSFQTIQHRLAGAAVKIEAAYWLVLKAAQRREPADAATALGYVQEASTKIIYDLHQFMGAMGLTLEHPLHRWTYRARLLRSSLGGASANLRDVSNRRWRAA